jgi:hypothetical protein
MRNPSSSRQTDSGTRASPSSSFSSTASSTSSRGVATTIVVLVLVVARKKGKEREKERAQKSRILLFFVRNEKKIFEGKSEQQQIHTHMERNRGAKRK